MFEVAMVLPMAWDTSAGLASPTKASCVPDRRKSAKVRFSSGPNSRWRMSRKSSPSVSLEEGAPLRFRKIGASP